MDFPTIIHWLAPPVLGAFIGYLTNRVAIRMLFRPLKAWRVLGIRVPMTPGVIPSKRSELADNMGEVVGEHLLTSEELGQALGTSEFRGALRGLLEERLHAFLERDLGPLPQILPAQLQMFVTLGLMGLSGKLKGLLADYVLSEKVQEHVCEVVRVRYREAIAAESGTLLTAELCDRLQDSAQQGLAEILAGEEISRLVKELMQGRAYEMLRSGQSCADLMPQEVQDFLLDAIEEMAAGLPGRSAVLLRDQGVQDQIVAGIMGGVDKFIDSLGSASEAVRNFVKLDVVEHQIRKFLISKEGDIAAWLGSQKVSGNVEKIARARAVEIFNTPLVSLMGDENENVVELLCESLSQGVISALQREKTAERLVFVLREYAEEQLAGGTLPLSELMDRVLGEGASDHGEKQVVGQVTKLFASAEMRTVLDSMVDSMLTAVREKPLGRLARFLPPMVVSSVAEAGQGVITKVLAAEIPGLVQTLGIRRIITSKINSLDLLRLERLLLSIMEEQFKYINLFGALLGFLIGCLNLIFLLS